VQDGACFRVAWDKKYAAFVYMNDAGNTLSPGDVIYQIGAQAIIYTRIVFFPPVACSNQGLTFARIWE